nr:DUF3333 domain-containing protein [Paracoccus sp. (in: a-proteobacteria)]
MTDASFPTAARAAKTSLLVADPRTRKRNAAEARFRAYGVAAIAVALVMLVVLLVTIFSGGIGAFRQTYLTIPVTLDAAQLDKKGARNPDDIKKVLTLTYGKLLDKGLTGAITDKAIEVPGLTDKDISGLISKEAAADLRARVLADPGLIGQTVPARVLVSGRVDGYYKGRVSLESAARDANTSPAQLALADALKAQGMLATQWNWSFLTSPDASDQRPEAAGVSVAILGALYMMLVVLALAVPIGGAALIFL